MAVRRWIILGVVTWLVVVTLAHLWLNLGVFEASETFGGKKFRVGFLPVT
jgi:hypothetical protein